jgi:hypothetical protein
MLGSWDLADDMQLAEENFSPASEGRMPMRNTRRDLGKLALSAVPAAHMWSKPWRAPVDSTVMAELKKCIEFCKVALA